MNQAERALKTLLEPTLRERGFKPQASSLAFKRRTSFGFDLVSFTGFAWAKGGPYEINVGLGVRHNQVDEVVNRLGHIWGEANQKNTTTVYRGLEFFPFDDDRDGRKVISSDHFEKDVSSVSADVSDMLSSDGFEFLQTYSDIYACSVGLNAPIETSTHPLLNNFPLRAYYGIAAAAFSQPARVPSLLQCYTDFAQQTGSSDNGVYEVGKEFSGIDAIIARLKFVADTALASAE